MYHYEIRQFSNPRLTKGTLNITSKFSLRGAYSKIKFAIKSKNQSITQIYVFKRSSGIYYRTIANASVHAKEVIMIIITSLARSLKP